MKDFVTGEQQTNVKMFPRQVGTHEGQIGRSAFIPSFQGWNHATRIRVLCRKISRFSPQAFHARENFD